MNHIAPIRIVTISRQSGAGGREVAERLAQSLQWKVWDKDLLGEIARHLRSPEAELAQMDQQEVDRTLWGRLRNKPAYRAYLTLLKECIDQVGEEGRTVLVGRGASILLRYRAGALHLRLVAPLAARKQRVQQRDPGLDPVAAEARCVERDEERSRFIKYFFGEDVADPLSYHATIHTGAIPPAAAAQSLVRLVQGEPYWPGSAAPQPQSPSLPQARIVTLSSQLGSRETDLARELARRMNLRCWDREALGREAGIAEGPDADLGEVGPKAFEAFAKAVGRIAEQGDAIMVGGGGTAFLKDRAAVLRVKLIAPLSERVRRVGEYRWIDPRSAETAIAESDKRRGLFYEQFFGLDWDDPLNFDMVLNTAALGPRTVALIAEAANLKWHGRPGAPHAPRVEIASRGA